jgi:hypothetical protein
VYQNHLIQIKKPGRLPGAERRGRAIRSKSSDLPMQILWAFRSYPWRERQRRTRIFTAKFFDLSIVKKPMVEEVE